LTNVAGIVGKCEGFSLKAPDPITKEANSDAVQTVLVPGSLDDAGGPKGLLTYDQSQKLGLLGLVLLACVFGYLLTFLQVGFPVPAALEFACINVIAASVPGVAIWWLTRRMASAAPTLQAVIHVPLALGYSWIWYIVGRLLGAGLDGARGRGFELAWLPEAAIAWQLTQGISVYAAVVAAAYATLSANQRLQMPQQGEVGRTTTAPAARLPVSRFLARAGEGFAPIAVADIVLIEGADDYSEVTTLSGERRLVRLSLKAFEAQLASANFLRVHRSALIALDRLISAEPAGGGRMLLHLPRGRVLQTSREGARRLRARMI